MSPAWNEAPQVREAIPQAICLQSPTRQPARFVDSHSAFLLRSSTQRSAQVAQRLSRPRSPVVRSISFASSQPADRAPSGLSTLPSRSAAPPLSPNPAQPGSRVRGTRSSALLEVAVPASMTPLSPPNAAPSVPSRSCGTLSSYGTPPRAATSSAGLHRAARDNNPRSIAPTSAAPHPALELHRGH